jgi:hypothetical protein
MNGAMIRKPKFFEGIDLPDDFCRSYEDGPYPYEKGFHLDLLALMKYAEKENKDINDMTRDEIMLFSTKDTFEETFPWLFA